MENLWYDLERDSNKEIKESILEAFTQLQEQNVAQSKYIKFLERQLNVQDYGILYLEEQNKRLEDEKAKLNNEIEECLTKINELNIQLTQLFVNFTEEMENVQRENKDSSLF